LASSLGSAPRMWPKSVPERLSFTSFISRPVPPSACWPLTPRVDTSWLIRSMALSPCQRLFWNTDFLAGVDQVRILDHFTVGFEDGGVFVAVAVKLAGHFPQSVAFLNFVVLHFFHRRFRRQSEGVPFHFFHVFNVAGQQHGFFLGRLVLAIATERGAAVGEFHLQV